MFNTNRNRIPLLLIQEITVIKVMNSTGSITIPYQCSQTNKLQVMVTHLEEINHTSCLKIDNSNPTLRCRHQRLLAHMLRRLQESNMPTMEDQTSHIVSQESRLIGLSGTELPIDSLRTSIISTNNNISNRNRYQELSIIALWETTLVAISLVKM